METVPEAHWLRIHSAASLGDTQAMWEVGYLYETGAQDVGGKTLARTNPKNARRYFLAAAQLGNSAAQASLCVLLSAGQGIERNFPEAIYWGRKAVAQGDAPTAYNIATIYRDCQKHALAFRWYQRAATMGDAGALLQVGLCQLFGLGTGRNLGIATTSLEAIERCDINSMSQRDREDAQYWLAIMRLLEGKRSLKSLEQARTLLEAANADDDHEQANALLNLIGKTKYLAK